MDTPAKSHALSASASNYEDSPVFHYINNLSPLELVKSSGTNQPFNMLSSASPLPVFTSPQIDTNKEHLKFQCRGLQLSGSLVLEFPENKNKDSPRLGVLKSSKELHALDGKSAFKSVVSAEHNAIMPTEHTAANQVAINTAIMHEQEYASIVEPSVPFMDGYERNIHKICHTEQSMEDSLAMVPAADSDVINFKSSNLLGNERIDPGSVVSTADIVQYPKGGTIEEHKLDYAGLVSSSAESELEQKLAKSDPVLSHVTLHELGISDSNVDMDESNEFVTASYRQSTLLRRCLFSEMATTNYNSMGASMSISDIREVVKWDSEASDMPLLNTTLCGAASASDYLVSGDASPKSSPDVNQAISLGRDLIAYDNEVHKTEDDCHTSAPVRKQFDQHSPLLKRSRLEQDMEITSCKRCNCRRSKCLKLYCECFAAGLYCIEPCSCQDCFNIPIFKDKVLETRSLIESRNPLAFAPKVIRGTDSYMEHVEEGTKTPASARHKQGCRCKRSSCLKKYCECFQVGVGCSFNCRCEGCKNTYGRKDELEGRERETFQRVRSSHVTAKYDDNEEEEHADPRKRGAAQDDRIQSEMPFILPKSHTGTFRSNGGAPRACSSTKLDTLCTFLGKHTLEKQDGMTLDAENRDVNQERLSTKCSPPGSLKHSSPRGKGVPHSLHWVRSLSSTAMRSSRRRVILKSITSFGKTLTESARSSNRSADPENT